MSRIRPTADNRHHRIGDITFVDIKLRPRKERCHRTAQQHRPYHSVYHQKSAIRRLTQQIARLRLELIADGLQHESKQDNHPQPVGSAETRTVKQRERRKERPAERHERSKRKLPLPPRRVDYHLTLLFRLAQTKYQRVTPLHKQQENK